MPQFSQPSPRFIQGLKANLDFWREQTASLSDDEIKTLTPDLPNVVQAVTIGLSTADTYQPAGQLLTQCFLWAESIGALAMWQSLLEKSLQAPFKLPKKDKLVQLKQLSQCYRRQRQLDEAIHCLEVALTLTSQHVQPKVNAELHINMSQVLRHKGLFLEAEAHAKEALDLLPLSEARLIAIAWQTLGNIAQATEKHAQAESFFLKAVNTAPPGEKLFEYTRTMNALSLSLIKQDRPAEALALYQEMSKLLEGSPYILDKIEVAINWGALLYSLQRLDEAENIFRQAEETANQHSGMLIPKAHLANNLGCVLRDKEAWLPAEAYFRRSLQLWQRIGEPFFIAKTALNLAKLKAISNKIDAADANLQQAREIANQHRQQKWADALFADIDELMSQLDKKAGGHL